MDWHRWRSRRQLLEHAQTPAPVARGQHAELELWMPCIDN